MKDQKLTPYHRGQWVVVNPDRKLIASANSIDGLCTELQKKPDEHILIVMRVPQKGNVGE